MDYNSYMDKLKSTVNCCFGTFIWLWIAVLNYATRVNKLLFQLETSHEHISGYSVSIVQTKISTALQEYRIINWSFPFLVLLGILLILLVYRLNHYQEDVALSCDADEDICSSDRPTN